MSEQIGRGHELLGLVARPDTPLELRNQILEKLRRSARGPESPVERSGSRLSEWIEGISEADPTGLHRLVELGRA